MRTYEVIGYKTQADFDNRVQGMSEEGITVKREALKLGKRYLNEYVVVKVQSNDREFIKVLEKYSRDYFINKFKALTDKEVGRASLERHCALWHCGVRIGKVEVDGKTIEDYVPTDESTALIKLFGGKTKHQFTAVYSVNDGYDELSPRKRILNRLKTIIA